MMSELHYSSSHDALSDAAVKTDLIAMVFVGPVDGRSGPPRVTPGRNSDPFVVGFPYA